MAPPGPLVSRRAVLAGGVSLALLTACGGGDGDGEAADANGTSVPGSALPALNLIALFHPQASLVAGSEQRFVMGLADAEGVTLDAGPAEIEFRIRKDGEQDGVPVTATAHDDGLAIVYYPVRFTFDEPSLYEVSATVDGEALEPRTFEVKAALPIPGVGDRLPPIDTPTTTDERGVDPLCTRDPACPFHEITLTDALASGRPVAFLLATPEFCQTAVCGPVLDVLVDVAPEVPGVQFVHSEIYANPRAVENILEADLTEAMQTYGLEFEPTLFVADATGTVVARLDNIYDRVEALEVLNAVV